MVDFPSFLPAGLPANPALLSTLLDLLPMGVMYYTPVVDAVGTLTDLALVYLNPAAQRMTQLPAQPGTTYRQQFPTTDDNGAWDFHRHTWLSGEPQQFQFYYDADGFDAYFRVTAQRLGEGLLTIFTDTQDEVRSQVELALHASQARERAARAEAEAERRRFQDVLLQLPAQVAINRGPDHVFALVNGPYQQMFPTRPMLGLPVRQALPELQGQPFFDLLDRVYQTGEPFYSPAMPASVDFTNTGRLEQRYVDVFFQALHNAQGQVDGVLNFSYDVTAQELARQQVQLLNEELAALNEELRATNHEYQQANVALSESQLQLRQLNQELEARVQERTQAAERQRRSVVELVEQAPAALCIVSGPDFVYETFNPLYADMFGGRPRVGRPMGEVLPEVVNHPGFLSFRAVYAEGRTFRQSEVLVPLARPGDGVLEDHYFSYTQQPRYNSQGQIDGVFVFAVEVTEQVLARRQVEQLNQELEARVQERTQQLAAAQAAAERERARLQALIEQAPVAIGLFEGEELRVTSANAVIAALWGYPPAHVVGRPLLEAVPELQGQGFDELLRQVLHTQEPVTGTETPAQLLRDGELQTSYYNFVYQPLYDAEGQVLGVIDVAVDVTAQVLARRQVEQLNEELETRVQQRTREALALQTELLAAAQRQAQEREELYQVFEQVPVVMALLREPEHLFYYRNPAFQNLFPGRALTGRPYAEAMPEIVAAGLMSELDRVYATGQPYYGTALPIVTTPPAGAAPHQRYYDFSYQPYREDGRIVGVSIFAYDVTAQVQARQDREAQQRELYALFEQAPAGVCILGGPELVFEFVNPAYQRLLPGRALLGQPILAALPELAGTDADRLLRQVYATGQTHQAQELHIPVAHPSGSGELEDRYFTFVYQARRDERATVTGVLNFVFEVTEQVRARQRVEASAQQVRDLVAGVPFPIGLYAGPELRIELANQAILDGWGKGPNVIGQRFVDVLPELVEQGVIAQLQQVQTSGEALHLRGQQLDVVMAGQPQTFYYNYSFTPLHDAQGQVYGVLNTAADVTDQVVARQQLLAQQLRLRYMFAQAPVAIFVLRGTDYIFEVVNTSMGQMLSMDPTYMLGKGYFELMPGLEAQGYRQLLNQVWHTGQEVVAQEQAARLPHHAEGETGYYNFTYVALREADGHVTGIMCVAVDVTSQVLNRQQVQILNEELAAINEELQASNEELNESNTQLTRTNVDLDNFIYTASHDLKAPITNIEGLLLALEHELPAAARTGDVSMMLNMMQDATERFRRTINHLTDLSRLQKEHNPDADAVALAPVVDAVRLDLTPLLAQTQGQLTVMIPEGLTVTFAEKNLRSVVYNLLSNAFKYHHPDRVPEVQLRSWLAGDYTVLEVQDNGLGLDLARGQDKLFVMFQRLHTHVEGTGIGLYMIKRIVENAGGRIEVSSELGQGSTFQVYFRR